MKRLCFGSHKNICGTIILSIAPMYDIRDDNRTVSALVNCSKNLSQGVIQPKDENSKALAIDERKTAEYFGKKCASLDRQQQKKRYCRQIKINPLYSLNRWAAQDGGVVDRKHKKQINCGQNLDKLSKILYHWRCLNNFIFPFNRLLRQNKNRML